MQTKRQSNFELLRIISMFLIIMNHYAYHGQVDVRGVVTRSSFVLRFFTIGGNLGVTLFIMVSCYFLVDKVFTWRRFVQLILETWLYSVFVQLLFLLLAGTETFTWDSLIPIPGSYWFIDYYLLLVLTMPALSRLLKRVTMDDLKALLLFLVLFLVAGPFLGLYAIDFTLMRYLFFIFIYFLMAYIKQVSISREKLLKLGIQLSIIASLIYLLAIIILSFRARTQGIEFDITDLTRINHPLMLALSCGLFLTVQHGIKENYQWINRIASHTLGVYLLHEHPLVRPVLWNYFDSSRFTHLILSFVAGIWACLQIFVAGFILAALLDRVFKPIVRLGTKKLGAYLDEKIQLEEIAN